MFSDVDCSVMKDVFFFCCCMLFYINVYKKIHMPVLKKCCFVYGSARPLLVL